MSFCKENGSIARYLHRFQFLLLVSSLRVVDIVEGFDALLYALLYVQQTCLVHLAVHSGMTCCTLFHELREYSCMIGFLPFLRNVVEDALPLRLASPVRYHLALVGVNVLLRDVVALQLAGVESMQVFYRVTGQLWESGHRLWYRTAFAHDEFVVTNVERLLLAYFVEIPRPQHWC